MNKEILNCAIISPMFSFGSDRRSPELRTSELKALMRYIFRIANTELMTSRLFEAEARRFGDAEKHASPVRLQMKPQPDKIMKQSYESLLLHEKKTKNTKNTKNKVPCFPTGESFQIVIRTKLDTDLAWYREWITLSLILGGIGKRTRRGRGCVAVDNPNITKQNILYWIADRLNELNQGASGQDTSSYKVLNNEIAANTQLSRFKRPIIEKIKLGREINDINDFLTMVDIASHEIKKNSSQFGSRFATGFAGKSQWRFASSLIVSLTRTHDHAVFPVYTYVKAVHNRKELDRNYQERDRFISYIEGERH
ncbi:type III-B CRISPR module RAMP protein Cmr1 [Paenibacillus faecalis]|uniref:type III-B CRISPR module RAMP protein Cmr1 n=1 Tax=Paenibacillus faecalis TaxID=2079532 RepID=UPI000D1060D1|nr:type III-B CRISPR module RAMP protein Cmr1 [Paenibacillus faecalis]